MPLLPPLEPLDIERYRTLRANVILAGYEHDITWSQSIQPVSDPDVFWSEYSWVVINSGMKNQVAERIWHKVYPMVTAGGTASAVFGHRGKTTAIDQVWRDRVELLAAYQEAEDKLKWLQTLPWIGPTTCWHLAKNYGMDVAKPDRHLVRIAGAEGTHPLCERLSRLSGDRIATVDTVIWRAANLGWI